MSKLPIFLIKVYKKLVSPILPNTCRFHPSCSSYSLEAFEKYGFLRGLSLSIKRILRCNPWNHGGYDPVK